MGTNLDKLKIYIAKLNKLNNVQQFDNTKIIGGGENEMAEYDFFYRASPGFDANFNLEDANNKINFASADDKKLMSDTYNQIMNTPNDKVIPILIEIYNTIYESNNKLNVLFDLDREYYVSNPNSKYLGHNKKTKVCYYKDEKLVQIFPTTIITLPKSNFSYRVLSGLDYKVAGKAFFILAIDALSQRGNGKAFNRTNANVILPLHREDEFMFYAPENTSDPVLIQKYWETSQKYNDRLSYDDYKDAIMNNKTRDYKHWLSSGLKGSAYIPFANHLFYGENTHEDMDPYFSKAIIHYIFKQPDMTFEVDKTNATPDNIYDIDPVMGCVKLTGEIDAFRRKLTDIVVEYFELRNKSSEILKPYKNQTLFTMRADGHIPVSSPSNLFENLPSRYLYDDALKAHKLESMQNLISIADGQKFHIIAQIMGVVSNKIWE